MIYQAEKYVKCCCLGCLIIIHLINQKPDMDFRIILTLLILLTLSTTKPCDWGEISRNSECVHCRYIPNTNINAVEQALFRQQCPCKQGFVWSNQRKECTTGNLQKNTSIQGYRLKSNFTAGILVQMGESQRMLQTTTCNHQGGFIPYENIFYTYNIPVVCYNCRLTPNGLPAIDSSTCGCYYGFTYYAPWTICYCFRGRYIDPATNQCKPCISSGPLEVQCWPCSAPFRLTQQGCIYMPSFPNGVSGGCAVGYYFSFGELRCICNYRANYSINANGVCTKCATTDSVCINCRPPYYLSTFRDFQCIHGSLLTHTDFATATTTTACKTGAIPKLNPVDSRIVGCACSFAAQYYQNSQGVCVACSASLPSGVSLANCQACANSAKFYKGSVQCIYCPGIAYTVAAGTATANGCDCLANYYWNANTDKCECDFALGYIGGAISPCLNCANIDNTDIYPIFNACSCKPGYKWNSQTNTCGCDTSNGLAFLSSGICVSCGLMPGGIKTATDGQSCICLYGYVWNQSSKNCDCDFARNYVVNSKDICADCKDMAYSNGLANSSGCVCINGFSWDSSKKMCACPSGNVVIGRQCTPCSTATLGSTTVSDCTACASNVFGSVDMGCFLCSQQTGSTGVISGQCACETNSAWRPGLGVCACDWTKYVYTVYSSATSFFCRNCSQNSNTLYRCYCKNYDPINQVCISSSSDSNFEFLTTNVGRCKPGSYWLQTTLPYRCASGHGAFAGYTSLSTNTMTACGSTDTACLMCNPAGGYLYVSAINQCIKCSTVTRSTGAATTNGCVCNTGFQWNGATLSCVSSVICLIGQTLNVSSNTCVCDTTKSIVVSGACVPCSTVTSSNGVVTSNTSCGCTSPNTWSALAAGGGVCCGTNQYAQTGNTCYTCTTANGGTGLRSGSGCGCTSPPNWSDTTKTCMTIVCNPTDQLTLDSGCFSCPSTPPGTGLVVGTDCGCASPFKWSSSSRTCICDLSIAYTLNNLCIQCPTNTTGGNGSGGCTCTLSTDRWQTNACRSCSTVTNTIILSGNCFVCGTSGTNTLAKATNISCTCMARLIWNPSGFCDCGANSAMITSGNTFSCFACANATANTVAKASISSCSCVSNSLTWNPARFLCDCSTTTNGIVLTSGTANARCVICNPSTQYMVGPSADRRSCVCIGRLTWLSASGTCGCTSPTTMVIIGSNFNTQCMNCSSIPYATTVASSTTCNCIATGMTFSSTLGTCSCAANNIILPNLSCAACPAGSTPYTPYECLCAPGSIWLPAQGCLQCGSVAIPNSLSTGGTNFACACSTGFIWDVRTKACIAHTCTTATLSCMRCASGTAVLLVAANTRNLAGGAAMQILLAGPFTNYNQTRGFQCTCATTHMWDSMRQDCFPRGLA